MVTDAASAGFSPGVSGKKYPRRQLLTIEGLMDGSQRAEHPDAAAAPTDQPPFVPDAAASPVTFKQAKKETSAQQPALL